MDLWDTKSGDRWLCGYCQKELADTIDKEKWRLVFKRMTRNSAVQNAVTGMKTSKTEQSIYTWPEHLQAHFQYHAQVLWGKEPSPRCPTKESTV